MTASHALPVTAPASGVAGPPQGEWTYTAYAAIPDDGKRYEVIDGVLFLMPAPNVAHQNAVTAIGAYLRLYTEAAKLGKAFVSPIDVRLTPENAVVQPDVVVVLNEHRAILQNAYIFGAPDLVVEVSSPSTATYDRRTKMDLYARAGVPEYWIADPYAETVECFMLEAGEYRSAGVFGGEATLPSAVLPNLPVRVEQFFA